MAIEIDGWSVTAYRKVVGRTVLTVERHKTYKAWDWAVGGGPEGPAGMCGRELDVAEAMKMAEHFAKKLGGG